MTIVYNIILSIIVVSDILGQIAINVYYLHYEKYFEFHHLLQIIVLTLKHFKNQF